MFLVCSQLLVCPSLHMSSALASVERRRRFNINDRIKELGTLIPKSSDPYVFTASTFLFQSFFFKLTLIWKKKPINDCCHSYGDAPTTTERCAGIKAPSWKPLWTTSESYKRSSREPRMLKCDRKSWSRPTTSWCCGSRSVAVLSGSYTHNPCFC